MTLTATAPASVTAPIFKAWSSVYCLSCKDKGRNTLIGKVREDHRPDTSEFYCKPCHLHRVV